MVRDLNITCTFITQQWWTHKIVFISIGAPWDSRVLFCVVNLNVTCNRTTSITNILLSTKYSEETFYIQQRDVPLNSLVYTDKSAPQSYLSTFTSFPSTLMWESLPLIKGYSVVLYAAKEQMQWIYLQNLLNFTLIYIYSPWGQGLLCIALYDTIEFVLLSFQLKCLCIATCIIFKSVNSLPCQVYLKYMWT